MSHPTTSAGVIRQLGAIFESGSVAGLGDSDLLARFGDGPGERSEAAFSTLVERHGPMVLRVCRANLRDPHDADDAFQATFIVLARRAGSLRMTDSLGPWLHGVACRVAAGARTSGRRRARLVAEVAEARRPREQPRDDLGPALHEEIDRLPPRFREAVVLCHLEGLTHDEAADRLACPVGTVRSRLARGRDRLRRALARRGFAAPGLPEDAKPPVVPASMILAATRAAAKLPPAGLLARWLIHPTGGILTMLSAHPIKSVALFAFVTCGLAIALKASDGREQGAAPVTARADTPPDPARFAAMEARLRDLERKIEAIEGGRPDPGPALGAKRDVRKVRPRFDNALIERVFVSVGQVVKKGEPLVEVRSTELTQARIDCRTKFVQWDHDYKYLVARAPLAKEGRITQIIWSDTQNDEKKSRLDYLVSREKLDIFGMSGEQIDKLLENFGDNPNPAQIRPGAELRDLSTFTILSPVDGKIIEVGADRDNFYSNKDVLVVIAAAKP